MFETIKNYAELFNTIIRINNDNPIFFDFNCEFNTKSNIQGKIPISNKYFLSILPTDSEEINKFFSWISDGSREEYPFDKKSNIDYSLGIEMEQFLNMDILNSSLRELDYCLEEFLKIVAESNGEIYFIIDIKFLMEFEVLTRQKSQPNHLIEMILWVLKNKIDGVILFDSNEIVKNNSNMLYIQFESCIKNFNPIKYNLDKNILVYRNSADTVVESVYWNVLFPEIKISEYDSEKIKSPYDNTYFQIVKINGQECFLYKINLLNCINKNLINLENEPGIIIEPIDRLNIFM